MNTPRTDKVKAATMNPIYEFIGAEYEAWEWAKELERENAKLREDLDVERKLNSQQLLKDIVKRNTECAKEINTYRDMNPKGSAEYAFRDGQSTAMENEAGWAEDMLKIFFSDNAKDRHAN